eukprot:scaffold1625_cov192-Alexandrium_tamarense.AAC.10
MSVQRTLSPVPERRKRGSWTVVVRRTNASEEVRVTTKTGDEDDQSEVVGKEIRESSVHDIDNRTSKSSPAGRESLHHRCQSYLIHSNLFHMEIYLSIL